MSSNQQNLTIGSIGLKSDYRVVKISLTTGLGSYPEFFGGLQAHEIIEIGAAISGILWTLRTGPDWAILKSMVALTGGSPCSRFRYFPFLRIKLRSELPTKKKKFAATEAEKT